MKALRILDLTRVLAGPWAVQHLADQGADVIKVEPPDGDETRRFGPVIDGRSTYFLAANRNKRSISLDLKSQAGRRVLERLVDWADVLVQNYRPGVAERLGFGWEQVRGRRPDLVYVAIHAFGDEDPEWSARPGYDLLLQHMGGATAMTGFPGDPPLKHPASNADALTGLFCAQAVLQGVLHREWTGEGQKIVVNMMQVQAASLVYHASRYAVTGIVGQQRGNSHAGIVPYDVLQCADGWLVVACANDATWQRLREALDLPDRPEWRANAGRVADRDTLMGHLGAALSRRTVADAQASLEAARVPAGPVLTLDQALSHPAVERVRVDHDHFGRIDLPGPAFTTATTRAAHQAPPALAAHRDEILADLGFDAETVSSLADSGAFGATPARSA